MQLDEFVGVLLFRFQCGRLEIFRAEAGFSAKGFVGHTVEELAFPVAKFAEMAKMDCKKIFYSCGMMCIPGVTTEAQKAALIDKAKKHAADVVECLRAL